jgi:hypothetical protein
LKEATMAEQGAERRCECAKAPDGTCRSCVSLIGALARDLAGIIMDGQRRVEEKVAQASGLCGPCARRDWDLALAGTVRALAADTAGDRAQRVGSVVGAAMRLVEAGKLQGVSAYPLTELALTEMAAALGAPPPG